MRRVTNAKGAADDKPKRKPKWEAEGKLLAAALEARKIGPTEFARKIGAQYYNVNRWTKGYDFGPGNQRRAARGLGLSEDAFERPDVAAAREEERVAVLKRFRREFRQLAAALTSGEWRVLESIPFPDSYPRPTVQFYEAMAMHLKGALERDQALAAAEMNAAGDRTLEQTAPPKKRRSSSDPE
jgi:hypothetical protein